MIRHIVGWNLTAEGDDARAVAAEEVKVALESLVGVVDGLIDLTVSRNAVAIDGNTDLALIAHYATAEDLEAYIVHPEHQKAVTVVRARTKDRWAIDLLV